MAIRFARDLRACERFYALLGLSVDATQRDGGWMELAAAGGVLALHGYAEGEDVPPVELAFLAEEPLEGLHAKLIDAGFEPVIIDEAFGRSLRVTDPEGLRIQINENDRELYT